MCVCVCVCVRARARVQGGHGVSACMHAFHLPDVMYGF